MRKHALSLIALLCIAAPARSQNVDDIVAKYAQKIGGMNRVEAIQSVRRSGKFYGGGGFEAQVKNENKRPNKVREEFAFGGMVGVNAWDDKINSVNSLRRTGKFTGGGGFEAGIVEEKKRPNLVRQEFQLQGMTGVTAYDGSTGWKIEPWQGKKDAESLSEDEIKGIVEDAEFDDPLLDYQKKGNKAELVGMDQIDGSDVYKVKLTLASNGDVRTYYIDVDNFVPIKYEVKRMVRGAEREFEVELGDYKEVNGVFMPFGFAIGSKGSSSANKAQYAWERIEANVGRKIWRNEILHRPLGP